MKKLFGLLLTLSLALTMIAPLAMAENQTTIGFITTASEDKVEAASIAQLETIKEYEEATGVDIVTENYPDQTAYQQKLYTYAAAGDLPEVMLMKGSWLSEFVDNGWILDITDYLSEEFTSQFHDGTYMNFTNGGRIYGIPSQNMTTSIVFYNKTLWAEAGYDAFPTTWDELIEAAPKFAEMGITEFVLGNKDNWPAESCWFSTLADRGAGLEWTQNILKKDGSAAYTDPGIIEALAKFQELALTEGAMNANVNSIDNIEAHEVFANGKAAAIVEGSWFLGTMELQFTDLCDEVGLAILPTWEGAVGEPNTTSGGPAWSYALSPNAAKTPERLEECLDFLLTVAGPQMARKALELGELMSMNIEFDTSKLGPMILAYQDMMQGKSTVPIWDACMDAAVVNTFNVGLQELLIGTKTPEELAEETQMEYEMGLMG